jgi:hypothetical protein
MNDDFKLHDGWMELNAFCEKYQQRANTIHKRVTDGVWPRGEFYAAPSGSVGYVHEKKATEWLASKGKLVL